MARSAALPAASETVRCSDYARSIAVDPAGTAIRADLLVAAEVPRPWPKPVAKHPMLAGVDVAVAAASAPTRVLASVPACDDEETMQVTAYRRTPGSSQVQRRVWRCATPKVADTAIAIIEGRDPADADEVLEAAPQAEVWICTQGSHDLCCGSEGTRLAQAVEGRWSDVTVRRVSHTGGHRFAPTAITLPDGRMWAHLDVDALTGILRREGDPRVVAGLAARCRGWWGAEVGPAQVAEREVFAATGWVWETAPRRAEVVAADGDVTTVRVTAGDGNLASWLVRVAPTRDVPTISCRAPGGLPAKPGVEYGVVDLQPVV